MELVKALREASDFYAQERPRGVPPNLLSNEIGPAECEAIARRFDAAATRIESLETELSSLRAAK